MLIVYVSWMLKITTGETGNQTIISCIQNKHLICIISPDAQSLLFNKVCSESSGQLSFYSAQTDNPERFPLSFLICQIYS